MKINIDDIKNISPNVDKNISPEAEDIFSPDQERNESEKQHFHNIKIFFLWSFMIGIAIIGFVILLHLILPEKCRWLPSNDIMNLKSILISGVGGAILTKFGNKLIE